MERIPDPRGRLTGAIILAGGRGSRLGGHDKALLTLDGVTLLERALAALADSAALAPGATVTVVGPERPEVIARLSRTFSGAAFTITTTRETPAFAGPAAAVAAGAAALGTATGQVLLLAVDCLRPREVIQYLLAAAPPSSSVLIPTDATGRQQPLASLWPAPLLLHAISALEAGRGLANASMRHLLAGVDVTSPHNLGDPPPGLFADADTWEDMERAAVEDARLHQEDTMAEQLPHNASQDDAGRQLEAWVIELLDAFDLQDAPVDVDTILSLAGEAAHTVVRPAAPVTTYVAGYAAGLAAARDGAADAAAAADELARRVIAHRAATDAANHTDPES